MGRERSRSSSRSSRNSKCRNRSQSRNGEEFRVHVADLGIEPSRRELIKQFEKFGKITDIWVAKNPPCFAFIVYRCKKEADMAIKEMNGQVLSGGRIRVTYARPRTRGRKRQSFDPALRCYQCGEKGHFSRDCNDAWSRKRHYSRRSYTRSRSGSPSRRFKRRRSRSHSRRRRSSHSKSRSSSGENRRRHRSRSAEKRSRSCDRRSHSCGRRSYSCGRRSRSHGRGSRSHGRSSRSKERRRCAKDSKRSHSKDQRSQSKDRKGNSKDYQSNGKNGKSSGKDNGDDKGNSKDHRSHIKEQRSSGKDCKSISKDCKRSSDQCKGRIRDRRNHSRDNKSSSRSSSRSQERISVKTNEDLKTVKKSFGKVASEEAQSRNPDVKDISVEDSDMGDLQNPDPAEDSTSNPLTEVQPASKWSLVPKYQDMDTVNDKTPVQFNPESHTDPRICADIEPVLCTDLLSPTAATRHSYPDAALKSTS